MLTGGSVRKQSDQAFSFLLFAVMGAVLAFAALLLALKFGLGSADDGFFALVAKSFAMGVYGLPLSSSQVSVFDPYIGSGPVLIGIGALVTYFLGPQDSLGLWTLIVFILQLSIILILLSRRHSWAPTLGSAFVGVFLLVLISGQQWYFGVFIGEVPALGFLLLGTALLGVEERRSWHVVAGISFALAYLTKQIALFAVVGIVLSWLIYMAANKDPRSAIKSFLVVLGSMVVLPLLYEGAKLITLGLDGYLGLWRRTVDETARMAIGRGDNRLQNFANVISDYYGQVWLVSIVALFFTAIIVWQAFNRNKAAVVPLMLWCGAVVYLIYIAVASTMMPRYFWIGAAVLVFGFAFTLLNVRASERWGVIVLLVFLFGVSVYANVDEVVRRASGERLSEEREMMLAEIARHPARPVVGRSWHSFYDIVYLMPADRVWTTEERLYDIGKKDFLAILNSAFGDNGDFYNAVVGRCEAVIVGRRYSIYVCDDGFWDVYGGQ